MSLSRAKLQAQLGRTHLDADVNDSIPFCAGLKVDEKTGRGAASSEARGNGHNPAISIAETVWECEAREPEAVKGRLRRLFGTQVDVPAQVEENSESEDRRVP